MRKVYHLLAMGLFVPVFFWDLQLLSLSLAIAFAVLVLLEVLRCIRIPLIGQAVQNFMQVLHAELHRRQAAAPQSLYHTCCCCCECHHASEQMQSAAD